MVMSPEAVIEEERASAVRREIVRRTPSGLSAVALVADQREKLAELEQQERRISAEHRRIQRRIDHLRAGLGLSTPR
jgi:hypothetical protein